MTDELEQRLRAADPAPPTAPVDTSRSPRARTLVEQIMTDTLTDPSPAPDSPGPGRRVLLLAAAAVVVLAGIAGAAVLAGDDDTQPTAITLAGDASGAGPTMESCIQLSPELLTPVDLAFSGRVTSIDGDQVTLEVTKWFKGGDADEVIVTAASGNEQVLLGGVEFETDGRYLVTATNGTVNSCGMSGPYSSELESMFNEAFS